MPRVVEKIKREIASLPRPARVKATMLHVYYSERMTIPLPENHRFPGTKYRLLRDQLVNQGVLREAEIFPSPLATRDEIVFAHDAVYVDGIFDGTVDPKILKRVGFPWSEALVLRSLATVGGCLASARSALEVGVSGNLAGGTHHAHRDAGEGYCVFNDIAVSFLALLNEKRIKKAAIVDLDVHQGNGNSSILGGRDDIFIFSMHGARNYPFRKIPSTLDLDLDDHTGDDEYLSLLEQALPQVLAGDPDIVFYQAGVDPLREDALGKLDLTHQGLYERDRIVLSECRRRGIPISLSMGGGYAKPIEATVEAHVNTYRAVKAVFGEMTEAKASADSSPNSSRDS